MLVNQYNYSSGFPSSWVEWKHISTGLTHCQTCLRLDKCWFVEDNMPELPQHEYCHCTAVPKPDIMVQMQATAESAYSKYDPYLFNTNGAYTHRKEIMFHHWGYFPADIPWLKKEIERQGLEKYKKGDYILHKLGEHGQQINVIVTIPRKDKVGEVSFTTGWMVYPNGRIKLSTPYGDK